MRSLRNNHSSKQWAPWLFLLLFLFILRVLGQLSVVLGLGEGLLPPMEEWQSGLLPYPALLVSQFLIIFVLGKICIDFAHDEVKISRLQGKIILVFGFIYFFAMIARYIIQTLYYPQAAIIPVFFHWVLASFLILIGVYSLQRAET